MALGINTNVASINAQNQLSKSQSQNDQALERLSSGLRINSAKDDAAGLAISTRFESQINGLNQASRNANDGISLAQTAEGALDEITNNLQRVRELGVQSANATNNDSDRQALNDEVQQRIEEIDRIASETDFNGLNVIDGSLSEESFQVGANVGQTIDVDLENGAKADQLGKLAEADLELDEAQFDNEGGLSSAKSFDITVGNNSAVTVDAEAGDTVNDIADRINQKDIDGVVQAQVDQEGETIEAGTETLDFGQFTLDASGGGSEAQEAEFTLSPSGGGSTTITLSGGSSSDLVVDSEEIASQIDSKSGFSATANDDDTLDITNDAGETFELTQTSSDVTLTDDGTGFNDGDIGSGTTLGQESYDPGSLKLQAEDDVTVVDGSASGVFANADETDGLTAELGGSMAGVSVSDVGAANDAIARTDQALNSINSIRSELGAVQNRFESTIANLDNNTENLEASNSRIKDADFASESAKLSQSQVLQQAGISVLSQANQRPQQVLSLLQ